MEQDARARARHPLMCTSFLLLLDQQTSKSRRASALLSSSRSSPGDMRWCVVATSKLSTCESRHHAAARHVPRPLQIRSISDQISSAHLRLHVDYDKCRSEFSHLQTRSNRPQRLTSGKAAAVLTPLPRSVLWASPRASKRMEQRHRTITERSSPFFARRKQTIYIH